MVGGNITVPLGSGIAGMVIWGDGLELRATRSRNRSVLRECGKNEIIFGLGVDESYRGNVCIIRRGVEFANVQDAFIDNFDYLCVLRKYSLCNFLLFLEEEFL